MVIEDELGGDEGSRPRDGAAARFVDGDEKRATVFFVACHFHVLQESDELDETPAKLATVGLNQDQLEDVNHQEATLLLAANKKSFVKINSHLNIPQHKITKYHHYSNCSLPIVF